MRFARWALAGPAASASARVTNGRGLAGFDVQNGTVRATAVAVGTANFYEPQTAFQVVAGLRQFMQRKNITDVCEIVGSVQVTK